MDLAEMDLASQNQIPVIDLSTISPHCARGTQGWHHLCLRVREACETFGCFEVVYDQISMHLRTQTFSMIRQVFQLPSEIKKQNFNPKPYHGYAGQLPVVPLYESLGIEDASNYDSLKGFTQHLWPHGHQQFCQTIDSMMKPVEELHQIIQMMILDSYGLGGNSDSIMEFEILLRMMRYKAPSTEEYMNGLSAHTDKLMCTLLVEEEVSGLEIESRDGEWIKLSLSPSSLVFIVGDPLMAWSNGRLHAVNHRVMMKGDKDRYSFGAFAVPKLGITIKPPEELVDERNPRILKEFDFWEFLMFSFSKEGLAMESAKQIFAYAGN